MIKAYVKYLLLSLKCFLYFRSFETLKILHKFWGLSFYKNNYFWYLANQVSETNYINIKNKFLLITVMY